MTPLFVAKVNCEDRSVASAEWIRSVHSLSAEMVPSSGKRCIEGEINYWGMRMVWQDGIESIPTGDRFRCGSKQRIDCCFYLPLGPSAAEIAMNLRRDTSRAYRSAFYFSYNNSKETARPLSSRLHTP